MQFRTKARAVDLLGKGQIADLPTAITELWKNGYDAYADNLSAEMYMDGYKGLENPIFVISDDGKGMSRKDIIENWLVLGTDSKSRAILEDEPTEETLWKTPRVKAGEKGIGRLSVAFLGSPMLMLTKKRGYPLQALFFDWRLLENYNLFLEDISIPVEDITSLSDFTLTFEKLKNSFLRNFDRETDDEGKPIWEDTQKTGIQAMLFDLDDASKPRSQKQLRENIINSVRKSQITVGVLEDLAANLTNLVQHNGTKFLIFEPIEQLVNLYGDIDKEDEIEDKNFVLSSLLGFTNSFKDDILKINVSMPIHSKNGFDKDILSSQGNFFTSDDYALSDVVIDGEFDGLGSFSGQLTIYDEVIPYNFTNPRRRKSKSYYGKVPIKLGYSQGNLKDSKLDEATHRLIMKKLEAYGGLYVYRDGFRVLPYGRANMDFLNFEERRTKSAGLYYFSYRRMLGYIEISRAGNPDLIDKSSREGLITNAPYRAFVSDSIAFFVQLAKDYFHDEAKQNVFLKKKADLKQQHLAIKADQERELKERKEYSRLLSEFPERFNNYKSRYHVLVQELRQKLNQADVAFNDISKVLHEFQKLDIEFKKLIPEYSPRYKPTESQLDRKVKLESILENFTNEINQEKEPLMKKAMEVLEIKDLINQFSNDYRNYKAELETLIINHKTKLSNKFNDVVREYTERGKRILNGFSDGKEKMMSSIRTKDDVIEQMGHVSQKFESFRVQIDTELTPLVRHFERLSFDFDEEQIQGIYKEQFQQIKQQWSDIQETAQLGIAVEIIDHEFNVLYATINRMLSSLHQVNTIGANESFMRLEVAFKHLEDKYALLSPLYRISDAIAKEIRGAALVDYIKDFFSSKINSEGIVISSTAVFNQFSIKIKEPVIHTVLINIVNNAVFWLRNSERKEIRFDYFKETNEILILNSGEKIEDHRIEKIFDLFYSNRPNGRGIGLFLAKQTLNQHYFDIYSTNDAKYNYLNGACFVIKPFKEI